MYMYANLHLAAKYTRFHCVRGKRPRGHDAIDCSQLEMRVLFPTLGGPTTASTMGGGSKGVRSTTGKWSFLVCTSSMRLTDRAARTVDFKVVVIANTELRV